MSDSRSLSLTALYSLLRYTPLLAGPLIVELDQLTGDSYLNYFDGLTRLAAVLVLWGITEGVCMLWVREKNSGSPRSRGYGALTLILCFIVLAFLQIYRLKGSQLGFIILLAALSLRGMTRAGWEQGRPHVSVATSIIAHALVAQLSFLMILGHTPWQTTVLSLGIGALVGALEATWNADQIYKSAKQQPWFAPLHRLSLVLAPLAVGSLAMLRLLPSTYLALYALLFLAIPLGRSTTSGGSIAPGRFVRTAGLYTLFLAALAICRVL
jgi:hypothetical protein